MKFLTGPFSANNPVIVQILGSCTVTASAEQDRKSVV